jgi:uncharacterized protein YndB with AHSA1/START domain
MRFQIRRLFAAPKEKVYRAWIEREALEQWMCRDVPTHRVKYLELEVKTGGGYVMEVTDTATGEKYIGHGIYREVTPPDKLVFTWAWKRREPDGREVSLHPETQVTVEFYERGRSTEVVLTHEFFETEKTARSTEKGWEGCFDALAHFVEGAT